MNSNICISCMILPTKRVIVPIRYLCIENDKISWGRYYKSTKFESEKDALQMINSIDIPKKDIYGFNMNLDTIKIKVN